MKILYFCLFVILINSHLLMAQPRTYALLVGMDFYDTRAYSRSYDAKGTAGVKHDIEEMKTILNAAKLIELRNINATYKKILDTMAYIGKQLKPGDQFIFYFSGHGDTIKDISGDEKSGFDQVLVAYDKYILDDDIYRLLVKYFTQTKNIMLVDACHSGTSYHIAFLDYTKRIGRLAVYANENKAFIFEKAAADCVFHETIYEPFDLIYFGATPDDMLAGGTLSGGVLTTYLGSVYRDAQKHKNWNQYNYRRLACELKEKMATNKQKLQYHEIGSAASHYGNLIPFNL